MREHTSDVACFKSRDAAQSSVKGAKYDSQGKCDAKRSASPLVDVETKDKA